MIYGHRQEPRPQLLSQLVLYVIQARTTWDAQVLSKRRTGISVATVGAHSRPAQPAGVSGPVGHLTSKTEMVRRKHFGGWHQRPDMVVPTGFEPVFPT